MGRSGKLKKSKVEEGSDWQTLKQDAAPAVKKQRSQTEHAKQKRKEHRRLRRQRFKARSQTCFGCREKGHTLETCPQNKAGICFRCGKTDHTTASCQVVPKTGQSEFPFAFCFICQKKGHLARSCPENPKGLYPQGGGCRFCGSVEHFQRDCPDRGAGSSRGKPKLRIQAQNPTGSADADDTLVMEQPSESDESEDSESDEDSRELARKRAKRAKEAAKNKSKPRTKVVKF